MALVGVASQVFGASTNREIVQRSVDLLRFIAREGEFSEHHIDGMFSVITSPNADLRITACKVGCRCCGARGYPYTALTVGGKGAPLVIVQSS